MPETLAWTNLTKKSKNTKTKKTTNFQLFKLINPKNFKTQ